MIQLVISISLFFFCSIGQSKEPFLKLFKNQKPIIAAIMVEKDLGSDEKVTKAIKWSKEQIKIAETQGMDGILFEFRGGKILSPKISDQHFEVMKNIAKSLVESSKSLVVGVEILWHYPEETIRLAHESGAAFVRLDFFSDHVIADKKPVPIDPVKILKYREKIGATHVVLLTDVQVKYSKMIDSKVSLSQSAKRARESGSEGLIVTSTKSGHAPSAERPREVKKGAGKLPVVIGSGFSSENVKELLTYADAAIVGTSISVKTGGPLLPKKVEALMAEVRKFRKNNLSSKKVR